MSRPRGCQKRTGASCSDDPYDLPSPDDYENWRELQDDPYDPYGDLFPDEYLPWP